MDAGWLLRSVRRVAIEEAGVSVGRRGHEFDCHVHDGTDASRLDNSRTTLFRAALILL